MCPWLVCAHISYQLTIYDSISEIPTFYSEYVMTNTKSTSATKWSFREPMKTHSCRGNYVICDTHSAHLSSFESAVAALFSLPPSLVAYVQCCTDVNKRRRATDQSRLLKLHVLVLDGRETNIATVPDSSPGMTEYCL